tara:strand:+ start:1847 stop:2389 length:543 start_codon:yes stop_codon:yes gene_type:complete
MNKFLITYSIFFLSVIAAGEISVSISENLVNEYLRIIGNHEIPKGKKGNQALWSIKNPYVKFEHGSAEFHSTITFKKEKINIKKNIKKNIFVEYSYDDNQIRMVIEDPIVKMERSDETYGKVDLSTFYQQGLQFQGPKPKNQSVKFNTNKGKVKVNMNLKKSIIYFEKGVVRVAIDLKYR